MTKTKIKVWRALMRVKIAINRRRPYHDRFCMGKLLCFRYQTYDKSCPNHWSAYDPEHDQQLRDLQRVMQRQLDEELRQKRDDK